MIILFKKAYLILFIALALASCSSGTKSNRPIPDTPPPLSKPSARSAKEVKIPKPDMYIDAIGYFPETGEFYVSLSFKQDIDYAMYERIGKQTDSIVFQTEETTRSRLPLQIAQQYLDLSLLDTLNVYDYAHHFITGARFVRVEYYQPTIESSFIAVFKPGNPAIVAEHPYYCTSPLKQARTRIGAVEKTNHPLTNRIIQELGLKVKYQWAAQHVQLVEAGSTLSIVAVSCENEDETSSYLTELKNGQLNVLSKYKGSDAFWQLLPLPITHHKRPILLITLAVPGSDVNPLYCPFIWEQAGYKMSTNSFRLKP